MEDAMDEDVFTLEGPGIDAAQVVARIREAIKQKKEEGAYSDAILARAERHNLRNLRGDDEFLSFYLSCLRESAFVDISDFPIVERRARFARVLVPVKKALWSLLRFYTYRLWSQQNQVNGMLLSGLEALEATYRQRILDLETRLRRLEDAGKDS